jgi:galactose mutarotase-like enzyme
MNYTIKNEFLTVEVSDAGAELQSIRTTDGTEYLWQGDPAFWHDRAPNIFPYVARMTQGRYTAGGKGYEMKIHGFIKYLTLQMEAQSADSITFRLDSCEATKVQYPYDFTYRIIYALKGSVLVTTTSVENRGADRMYFAIGGHPGFNVPLEAGADFEDYYLEFGAVAHPYRVGFTDTCFLTGQDEVYALENGTRIPLHHDLFDQDAVVLKHAARQVRLASDKSSRSVTVTYPDFPYIGFWHKPKSTAPYVCIEPWSALPSRDGIIEELSQQADLTALDGGKTYETTWTIEIQ